MSMLAEPRRKKKWSVDPRNSAWSNDESKFGQKLMERMGWSKGKGLGRNMQGSTDNIKVKVKNDSLGLGTNLNQEDNWIAHQDEFNQLLADLNNCHGQKDTTSESPPPDEPQGFSLEEKSKTSKKRVHYMKFTKGKDLSSRSESDLNCIFGKRSKSAPDQPKENNSRDSPEEEKNESPTTTTTTTTSEHDVESITKTTTSTLSMQEYFAQRMAKLKKRACGGEAEVSSSTSTPEAETSNETPSGSSEEVDGAVHANVDGTGEPKKKKKKKKRNSEAKEEMEETAVAPGIIEGVEDQEGGCSEKKKKKKRKKAIKEDAAVNEEDCSSTSGLEQNGTEEDLPPAKKKKHKAGNKDTDTIDGHGPTENLNVESEVVHKKKKKKHREQADSEVLVVAQEEVEKKSKKHKKEKKNN